MYDGKNGFDKIPEYMHDAVRRYVENGIQPGSFLEAIFSNDLKQAFWRADDTNRYVIHAWVDFICWGVPASCQGSVENFQNWVKMGGLNGHSKREQENAED